MQARDAWMVALPALVVGLAGGFLSGTLLDRSQAQAEAPAPDVVPRVTASGAPPPAPLAAPERAASRVVARAAPDSAGPQVSEDEVARALAKVAAPSVAAASGSGRLSGSVRDEDGAPVPGAIVVATLRSASSAKDPADVGGAAPAELGLEEYLRERASDWAELRAARRRAATGADGAYALDGLRGDGSYDVRAYALGYVVEAVGNARSVAPGQDVSFTATRVVEVPVELVYAGGGAPSEGIVRLSRGESSTDYAWSADEPRVRLVDGRVGLRAYAGDVRPPAYSRDEVESTHASEEVDIDVAANGSAPVRLVLEPRVGVRGRVVDEWGSGSLRAVALAVPASGEVDVQALAHPNDRASVRGGRYALLDLRPGTWAVGLSTWGGAVLMHEVVEIGAGVLELDLVIPPPDADANLVVHAYGPAGRLLRDLTFSLRHSYQGGSSAGNTEGRRAPDGTYWLKPGSRGGLRRGGDFFGEWAAETSYSLTIIHPELGSREVELSEGQREVTVRFEEPVSIRVVVEGYVGSGREGKLSVDAQPVKEDGEGDGSRRWWGPGLRDEGRISADGEALFEHLEPGTWDVRLMASTERFGGEVIASREVTVTSGEQVVRLAVPVLHEVHVLAPGLEVGNWLSLRDADDEDGGPFSFVGGRNATLDADHRAVFESVQPGEYLLGGNGIEEEIRVTVPCGEVYVDARTPDCLRVTIGDAEGLLSQAGLRSGDLIIGANGKSFTNANEGWEAMRGGEPIPLIVLRDGQTIDVTLNAPDGGANWWQELGGMLAPTSRP